MRFLAAIFCALLIWTAPLGGQTDAEDPYSIQFVRNNLQNSRVRPVGLWSSAFKDFQRLGDGVSIALLKILEDHDLKDPKTIQACLPLIHDSFSFPPIISMRVNKKPKVTLFLLRHMQQSISDAQTQRDIQETMDYVQRQTSSSGAGSPGL
jgi:hypothetical protein